MTSTQRVFGLFLPVALCLSATFGAPVGYEGEKTTLPTDGPEGKTMESREQQEEYLRRFYGLEPKDLVGFASVLTDKEKAFKDAIKRLQHMAGLPETGEIDEETRKVMELPRCGVSDVQTKDVSSRKKRFALLNSRWSRNDLTYKIVNFSPDMPQETQESEIARAFNVWSEHTPLTFRRVTTGRADIDVLFATYEHGDGIPFDGPRGVVAHAFDPQFGGDTHLDDSERFTAFKFSGINMFQITAHEFGHALGLAHSDVRSAVMNPFYRGFVPGFSLNQDDIDGIQYIYGRRVSATPRPTASPTPLTRSTTTTTRSNSSDPCMDAQFDAITQYNGRTYAFRGSQYFRLNDYGIDAGYPRNIASDWSGIPNNIDAALYVHTQYNYYYRNGRWYRTVTPESNYFFKGSQVWCFGTYGPRSGYPKSIGSEFPGLPDDIDSAFVWRGRQKIYFTKGNLYYRVTVGSGVDATFPKRLSDWNGLPNKIDAALQWITTTYFFSGSNYFRVDNRNRKVDRSYPRKISVWWLGCPDST